MKRQVRPRRNKRQRGKTERIENQVDDMETLKLAIIEENKQFLEDQFQRGFDMHSCDNEGKTLLHFAVEKSNKRMVKYLLSKGLRPDSRTNFGLTALHLAAINSKYYYLVEFLLNYNCPINAKDEFGCTALHYAVNKCRANTSCTSPSSNVISLLLRHGADVNVPSVWGETPFRRAIQSGSNYVVQLFLINNAAVNDVDRHGDSVLHLAVQMGNKDIVQILLDAGADVNFVTKQRKTALHLAANSAMDDIVNLLIQYGANVNAVDQNGKTPIFMPPSFFLREDEQTVDRRYNITRTLLDAGAQVNVYSNAGEPVFHQALTNGQTSIIELLLDRGADVHSRNADGQSALHMAIEYASEKVVNKLIDRGVPIDERTWNKATPLHIAVQFRKLDQMKLLLARGADINATDADGYTPLHYAARLCYTDIQTMDKILTMLMANGADPLSSTRVESPLLYSINKSNDMMTRSLLRYLALQDAMGDYIVIPEEIDNLWHQTYEEHQHELVNMKKQKIQGNITCFDVLNRSKKWLLRMLSNCMKNTDFVGSSKYWMVFREFPIYGEMVKQKFYEILLRKDLTEKASNYLAVMFKEFKLPILIINTIVDFYQTNELETFVMSCQKNEEKVGS